MFQLNFVSDDLQCQDTCALEEKCSAFVTSGILEKTGNVSCVMKSGECERNERFSNNTTHLKGVDINCELIYFFEFVKRMID